MNSKSYTGYQAWKGWAIARFGSLDASTSAYFRSELSQCGFEKLAGKRVLEIGFGNGALASWCRLEGAVYKGTEVIPDLVSRGLADGFDVYCADTPLGDFVEPDSLDLVVALDVFEHFDTCELRDILARAKSSLRSGGMIFGRVPSGDSPFARSTQYGDITHRSILGSSAIQQLADDVGLQLMQVREPCFVFSGLGVGTFLRRLLIHFLRRLFFLFITKIFMGGGSPVLTPNLVFVLKKE